MKLSIAGFALLAGVTLARTASASPVTGAPCDIAATSLSITAGQTASGRLDSSDCTRDDDSYADYHRLVVRSTSAVTIALRSDEFDAFLILLDGAGGAVEADDDGAGGTDSRIERTLGPGTYYVVANTLRKHETGAYTLAIAASAADAVASRGSCARDDARAVEVGRLTTGSLDRSDCTLGDGSFAEYFRLSVPSRQAVRITMQSDEFDTYVTLYGTSDDAIEFNDDGGDGSNSLIERTLDAGTYYIAANSLRGGATGDYVLSVTPATGAGPVTLAGGTCSAAGAPESIAVGERATGALAASDCRREDDTFARYFRLVLPSRMAVTITLESDDFDAFLVLRDANDETMDSDDDGAAGTNARIVETLDAGTYYMIVNTLREGETGDFVLTVTGTESATADAACRVRWPITVDQTMSGTLADTDCRQDDDSFADIYQLDVPVATAVTISLRSDAFDTYLVVKDASGTQLESSDDDRAAGGTNSRISRTLPAGRYHVFANSIASDDRGDYTLSIARVH